MYCLLTAYRCASWAFIDCSIIWNITCISAALEGATLLVWSHCWLYGSDSSGDGCLKSEFIWLNISEALRSEVAVCSSSDILIVFNTDLNSLVPVLILREEKSMLI